MNALTKDSLIVNPSKCELLTNDLEEVIRVQNSETVLYSRETAKYLGQILDSNGTSKVVVSRSFFGKVINILSRNPELSGKAKIRIFKTYAESKVNHLLPLMANRWNKADMVNNEKHYLEMV